MRNNKGVALFVSIALLFLLSVGAIVVLLGAYNYTKVTESQIARIKALKSAESGINYAYWKLGPKTDEPNFASTYPDEGSSEEINLGPGGYKVKIWVEGPSSGRYTIKSKVSY